MRHVVIQSIKQSERFPGLYETGEEGRLDFVKTIDEYVKWGLGLEQPRFQLVPQDDPRIQAIDGNVVHQGNGKVFGWTWPDGTTDFVLVNEAVDD